MRRGDEIGMNKWMMMISRKRMRKWGVLVSSFRERDGAESVEMIDASAD